MIWPIFLYWDCYNKLASRVNLGIKMRIFVNFICASCWINKVDIPDSQKESSGNDTHFPPSAKLCNYQSSLVTWQTNKKTDRQTGRKSKNKTYKDTQTDTQTHTDTNTPAHTHTHTHTHTHNTTLITTTVVCCNMTFTFTFMSLSDLSVKRSVNSLLHDSLHMQSTFCFVFPLWAIIALTAGAVQVLLYRYSQVPPQVFLRFIEISREYYSWKPVCS